MLQLHQAPVGAARPHELVVRAGLRDLALVDDENAIDVAHGRETVGDDQRRASVRQLVHGFLQKTDLQGPLDPGGLKDQYDHLVQCGALIPPVENAELDWEGLAAFWSSDVGADLRTQPGKFERELPFTARWTLKDLATLGRVPPAAKPVEEDFVILQGVVDLALFRNREIWILDHKTDDLDPAQLEDRVQTYRPQLALYAKSLERIHHLPVTRQWIHFLSLRRTVAL